MPSQETFDSCRNLLSLALPPIRMLSNGIHGLTLGITTCPEFQLGRMTIEFLLLFEARNTQFIEPNAGRPVDMHSHQAQAVPS